MIRRLAVAALTAGPLLLAPAATARSSLVSGEASSAGSAVVTLSNLHTLPRWAYPNAPAAVPQDPSGRALLRHREADAGGGAVLWPVRARYQRLLGDAHRLAGRRCGRNPRDR